VEISAVAGACATRCISRKLSVQRHPRHVDKQRKEVVSMYHKAVLAGTARVLRHTQQQPAGWEGTESLVSLQYPTVIHARPSSERELSRRPVRVARPAVAGCRSAEPQTSHKAASACSGCTRDIPVQLLAAPIGLTTLGSWRLRCQACPGGRRCSCDLETEVVPDELRERAVRFYSSRTVRSRTSCRSRPNSTRTTECWPCRLNSVA
jgi:hypothetical protein